MNTDTVQLRPEQPAELEHFEGRHSHEIQRDEDVLSLGAQRDLESLGTAIAIVAATALVFSHIKRGAQMAARITSARATTEARDG